MTKTKQREISPLKAGLALRCPNCGVGKLFRGYLKFDNACGSCGEDFLHADTADGPAVFVMLIAFQFRLKALEARHTSGLKIIGTSNDT
jgi:uncharacterized protein (DUF983 family)